MEHAGANRPDLRNFGDKPFIVIWEVTQACDLVCVHCRASARPMRSSLELSTSEGERLIDEVADMQVPVFVLTGGDPLKRSDIFHLVEYATQKGLRTSLTPSATPLLTREAVVKLKVSGLARFAISLDGSSASVHDDFRGVPGSFDRTLQAIRWANEIGLPVQINTSIARRNLGDFEAIARLLESFNIVLWSVFFLVPTGRGKTEDLISAQEFEDVFEKLYDISQRAPFDVKSTEAQHYRRFVAQRHAQERRSAREPQRPGRPSADGIGRAPRGLNDAKGFVFVSHLGEVFPSGFLPVSGGNIRSQSLLHIYRTSPLFVELRDTAKLKGKCGVCEFREICGGSRARAFALTGDPLGEEPCCVYEPRLFEAPA